MSHVPQGKADHGAVSLSWPASSPVYVLCVRYVRGRHKRIFDENGRAYLPPRQHRAEYAFNKLNKEDCQLGNTVSSCGGHGVLRSILWM